MSLSEVFGALVQCKRFYHIIDAVLKSIVRYIGIVDFYIFNTAIAVGVFDIDVGEDVVGVGLFKMTVNKYTQARHIEFRFQYYKYIAGQIIGGHSPAAQETLPVGTESNHHAGREVPQDCPDSCMNTSQELREA